MGPGVSPATKSKTDLPALERLSMGKNKDEMEPAGRLQTDTDKSNDPKSQRLLGSMAILKDSIGEEKWSKRVTVG